VPLPTTQAAALGPVASYTQGGQRPYGLDWTLGVQHVFKNNYTFEARYVGTRGIHLWNQDRYNAVAQVNPNNFIPTFFTMPSAATFGSLTKTLAQVKSYIPPGATAAIPYNDLAIYGSESNIVGYAPQASSTYHGLALQLNRRFANGISYIAAYTGAIWKTTPPRPISRRISRRVALRISRTSKPTGQFRSRSASALHLHTDL